MKPGDLVFFKRARETGQRKSPEYEFKGYGFGIMLGALHPFQKDPPAAHILRMLGTVGFVSFDDVGELLGAEAGTKLVSLYEDKYYGKIVDPDAVVNVLEKELPELAPHQAVIEDIIDDARSKLVDLSGRPL